MSKNTSENNTTSEVEFPTLMEMGINNPSQIERYTLRQEGEEDVLRIYYNRAKGSFLPSSRKYRFGRSSRRIVTDSGRPNYILDSEISSLLQKAVAELDVVVKNSKHHELIKASIQDEIDHLEKYFNARIEVLRTQIEQL